MARERNKGPLRTEEILRLFREIMSACLAQEEPLKVGYLGPEGTFTQTADAQALRPLGARAGAVVGGRGVPRGGSGPRGFRRRAGRELHRRHRSTTRSTASSGSPLQDLRRGRAAHPPVPHGHRWTRWTRSSASAAIRSRSRSAAAGSTSTCPTCSACRCRATPKARAARATRRARPPSPARPPPRSTGSRSLAAEIEDRDDNTTRFFVVGRKLFKPSGDDRTTILVLGAAHRFAGRAVPPARAAGQAQDQHDAHRVAAVAPQEVGLRVLLRHRRPRRRAARGQGARGAQEARRRCSACSGSYPRAVSSMLVAGMRTSPGESRRRLRAHARAVRARQAHRRAGARARHLATSSSWPRTRIRSVRARCALAAMHAALADAWLYPDGSGHALKHKLAAKLGVSTPRRSRSATARTTCWCCWPRRS